MSITPVSTFKLESGIQLLTRLTKKSKIEVFYQNIFSLGAEYGDVVELFSEADIIMSTLLVDMICEALVPENCNGLGTGVLVYKTDGKLNIEQLLDNLRHKLCQRLLSTDNKTFQSVLSDSLNNLFLLEIYDATQLYTTIHSLDNFLMEHRNISLVIFDTLTAFYWSEQGYKVTKMDVYIKNLMRIINNVTKEHKVFCIYTRPEYFCSIKNGNVLEKSEYLTDVVNHRIQVLAKNEKSEYQVNIRTRNSYHKKHFIITNNQINWQ